MAGAEEKLQTVLEAVEKSLDPQPKAALISITAMERRILAVRGYLRYPSMKRGTIAANWAWTAKDMEAFKNSSDFTLVKAAVDDVRNKFASGNPGYTLGVDSGKVRTLEEQIKLWNGNETVKSLGQELKKKALKEVDGYPDPPDDASATKFQKFLTETSLSGSPSNATPGLSQHGQAKAFDFVVMKGGAVVAGTSTATATKAWDEAGWTAKLKQAVQDAGDKFVGPLPAPYEPWHYTYRSAVDAGASAASSSSGSSARTFSTDMCGTSLRR